MAGRAAPAEGAFEDEELQPRRLAMGRIGATVDLLEHFHRADCAEGGYASVYETADGRKVPVAAVHHYAYRDPRLAGFNSYEFSRIFRVRKMTKEDKEWYQHVIAGQGDSNRQGAGRPVERYRLMAPNPLHESHLIVAKAKLGVPVWGGAPPPKEPPADDTSDAAERKRARFAEFMVANFVPWSCEEAQCAAEAAADEADRACAVELTPERWADHVAELEQAACLWDAREADLTDETPPDERRELEAKRRERMIAAGRLHDIAHVLDGFKTRKEDAVLLGKHRERARTLWKEGQWEALAKEAATETAAGKEAAKSLAKMQEKAERLRSDKDAANRLKDSKWATDWSGQLCAALPSVAASDAVRVRLRELWTGASEPAKRSLARPMPNLQAVSDSLKKALPPRTPTAAAADAAAPARGGGERPVGLAADPFELIDDAEYERMVAAHCAADAKPLLNPEQRVARGATSSRWRSPPSERQGAHAATRLKRSPRAFGGLA